MKKLKPIMIIAVAILAALIASKFLNSQETIAPSNDILHSKIGQLRSSDYYHQLTENQKKIYDALLPAVSEGKGTISVTNVDFSSVRNDMTLVTEAFENDHPELFWFRQIRKAANYGDRVEFTIMYYAYKTGFFDIEDKYHELMTAVDSLAEQARAYSRDSYEQAVFVHDYIVTHARYDVDALDDYENTIHDPNSEYIFSAYGCLVQGRTVCAGYAKAYQLVMQALGLDCNYASGYANDGRHAWNLLYLADEHYFVDITWDDYDLDREIPTYNYAFVTEEAISKTHQVDKIFDMPLCDDETYQYYRYHGYFAEEYDFETISEILSPQSNMDAAYIQFGSVTVFNEARQNLFQQGMIYQIPGFSGKKLIYYANNKLLTFTILEKQ